MSTYNTKIWKTSTEEYIENTQRCQSEILNPKSQAPNKLVIPDRIGDPVLGVWIPAFAGMTEEKKLRKISAI